MAHYRVTVLQCIVVLGLGTECNTLPSRLLCDAVVVASYTSLINCLKHNEAIVSGDIGKCCSKVLNRNPCI